MAAPGESNVVPLTGKPVFPPVCVNCCAPAQARLTVSQVFPHGKGNTVVSFHPFFCERCIATHRGEQKPDPTVFFRRLVHGWFLWIPIVGSGWALSVAMPSAWDAVSRKDLSGLAISSLLAAFFAAIVLGCLAAIWWGSRHLAVKKPSSISSAIHFSGDLSQTFEPAWRRFTFRNTAYTEQFRDANRHLLWTRSRPESQRAMILRHYGKYALYILLAVLAVLAIADALGYPIVDLNPR
jgi:hypothetical protein